MAEQKVWVASAEGPNLDDAAPIYRHQDSAGFIEIASDESISVRGDFIGRPRRKIDHRQRRDLSFLGGWNEAEDLTGVRRCQQFQPPARVTLRAGAHELAPSRIDFPKQETNIAVRDQASVRQPDRPRPALIEASGFLATTSIHRLCIEASLIARDQVENSQLILRRISRIADRDRDESAAGIE